MFLSVCNDASLNGIFYVVKNILNIIMIIAPILAIICLAIVLTRKVVNPDDKKGLSRIKNIGVALVFLFFIPVVVNVLMSILGTNYVISDCWNNAQKPGTSTSYIPIDDGGRQTILEDPSNYEKGKPKQLTFDYSGNGKVKAKFSSETMKIVENHLYDFDYSTFSSYMAKQGGAGNYIQNLGGVFSEYYGSNKKVSSVYEFQKVSEYVFGLMYIYGFDYYSGSKYCKWGGSCGGYTSSDDAFYPGSVHHTSDGLSQNTNFDNLITGKNEVNMTTNCNWTVDMVYTKAGIWSGAKGASYKSMCPGHVVKNVSDYQVGDVIHFFRNPIDLDNVSSWSSSSWYHVAYVGEVYDDYVVVYDGGSYFTNNRNFKWTLKKTDNSNKRAACHVIDLS